MSEDDDDGDVPPAKQCDLPRCSRPAIDPTRSPAACLRHAPDGDREPVDDREDDEPVTPPDEMVGDHPDRLDNDGKSADWTGTDVDIREYYRRIRPVLDELATVDEHPTVGLNDHEGWYITGDELDVEPLEDGYDKRRRPASMATDLDEVLDRLDRTLYALTSYKDRRSFSRWKSARFDDEAGTYEYRGTGNPTPDPADLRAVAVWGDIDLVDELKPQRGTLDDDVRATAEATLEAYIEEFAKLYGGRDAVYALDSVGGAYVFGAPEATLSVAEYVREEFDDETAGMVLREVIERSNEYLEAAQERVEERVDGAGDVIDPDWANNHNRQYKAPLSIHKDHDAVVTPLDVDDVEYVPTPVTDVDDELIDETREWAGAFTAVEHTDRASSLVAELWPDEYEATNGWQEALEEWIERQQHPSGEDLKEHATTNVGGCEEPPEIDTDVDVTPDREAVKTAVDQLDPFAVADDTIVHRWTNDLPDARDRSGAGKRAFVPTWGTNYDSGNANYIDEKGSWNDTANGDHGTVVEMALINAGGWSRGKIANGADWFRGLDELRSLGYDVPVWVPEATEEHDQTPYWALRRGALALGILERDDLVEREGDDGDTYLGFPDREHYREAVEALEERGIDTGRRADHADGDADTGGHGGRPTIEVCTPPERKAIELDVDERRRKLRADRIDDVLEDDKLHVWTDDPGVGKTGSSSLGLLDRDEPHAPYFPTHEKARDHITDDIIPDDVAYHHQKGSEQPLHDCCMDAAADAGPDETPECPTHGHPSEWERMCPIYERDRDDEERQQFEAIVREFDVQTAHQILDPHGGDKCAWQQSFTDAESADHVVGVHPYVRCKTIREGRINVVDEASDIATEQRQFGVEDLVRMANVLEDVSQLYHDEHPVHHTADRLSGFARELIDVVTGCDDRDTLEELDAPAPVWSAYQSYDEMAGHYIECEAPSEAWEIAEALAKVKVAVGETILNRMQADDWEGTPLSIDSLLAAAAAADGNAEDEYHDGIRMAIAAPVILDRCPWCRSELATHNGERCCSADTCEWHEASNTIIPQDAEKARAIAWLEDEPVGLGYEALPLPSELPDPEDTLVLDATADPELVAARFGVDRDDVEVSGDESVAMPNARVTQVPDGQYHPGTIWNSATDDEGTILPREDWGTAATRFQRTIDEAGPVYEQPLFVLEKKLIELFEFPENAVVKHFHAVRGLNLSDCDAVFVIGAPHAAPDDLRRKAELLAMGRDDLRAGGAEHTPRPDAPNPPIYRKLNFEDDEGRGRAVPTKHYTGLTGALFRETREEEIVQVAHRPRPILADEDDPVDVFLLTNVPTSLEIDDVVSFEALADPLEALLPAPEGAIELLEHVHDAVAGDDSAPDGFRAGELVEERPDGTIANKVKGYHRLARLSGMDISLRTTYDYVDELEELGLLTPEEYEQRAGVSYTADFATLNSALSVLSGNGGFKVAAKRRLRSLVGDSDGSLEWLRWAREVFGLRGDRCQWPPPDDPVG